VNEFFSGEKPWQRKVSKNVSNQIKMLQIQSMLIKRSQYAPASLSPEILYLVTECTNIDPKERPTIQACKEYLLKCLYQKTKGVDLSDYFRKEKPKIPSPIAFAKESFGRFLDEVDKQTTLFSEKWKEGFQQGLASSEADLPAPRETVQSQEDRVSERESALTAQVRDLQERLDGLLTEHKQMKEGDVSRTEDTESANTMAMLESRIQALTDERAQLHKELSSTRKAMKKIREARDRFQRQSSAE